MPTSVENTQQTGVKLDGAISSDNSAVAPRIGARAVVELLKHNQPKKIPPEFMLIDVRRRDAIESLLQLLTRFQLQVAKSPYANASVLSLITKYLVENGQCLFISKPDLGAIHLVDRVFDQLLNSDKFDREAWCLLAQTRFPITKFALQDFSFFFAPQNIGRRLLNSITLNLLGSAVSQKDQVRQAIGRFVDKLNQSYRSQVSEFNSVCIEIQAWFASQQRHLSKIDTKVSQVASGNAENDRSDPLVVEFLNREVGGKQLPELLVQFIYGEWRNSMRLTLRQEGEKSSNWKRQMSLTQSMVKIHETCQTEEGRQQYTRFLPSMLKGIKPLLVSVADDPQAFENAFDPLELITNALVRGAEPDLSEAPVLETKTVVNEAFEVVPVDEQYLLQVDELEPGDWIRIRTKGNHHEACRLSVKAPEAEPWLFVNNTGSKIAKKNRFALAQGLRDGVVEIVGKGQWIDDLLRDSFAILTEQLEAFKASQVKSQQTTETKKQSDQVPSDQQKTTEPQPDSIDRSDQVVEELAIESVPDPVEQDIPVLSETAAAEPNESNEKDLQTDISLVSVEEQDKSYHVSSNAPASRTDEILSGGMLSMVAEEAPEAIEETQENFSEESWEDYYQEEKALSDEEIAAAEGAVDQLEVGALVNRISSSKQQRCKLAVKMSVKDKYIFVDQLGVKVWDTNRQAVVEAVAKGELVVIDSGTKFDRALEQVVKNIQADKKVQG